jgi:adenylate cyclase
VLAHPKTSRLHARIERRRDKFVIEDTGSNRTFAHFDSESEVLLRREELVQRGNGLTNYGSSVVSVDAETPRFEAS